MQKGIRIAISVVMLMVMGLFLGMNSPAMADESKSPQLTNNTFTAPPVAIQSARKHYPSPEINRTSSNDTEIKSNTTVTKKTYNSNVWIYSSATYTVGKDGNIIINGDLNIGGTFKISSGTLTVNGDIWVFGSLQVSGTAKVIVNKAPTVIEIDGEEQYGGRLVVTDTNESGSYLSVSGSAKITVNYADQGAFSIQEGAGFIMNSASAKVLVYNRCYFGGKSTSGTLTAGTLEIKDGDFTQSNKYSNYSFCPGPSFKVSLIGNPDDGAWNMHFDSPFDSFFSYLTVSGDIFGDSSTVIPIRRDLTEDYSVNCYSACISYQGKVNGKKLTLESGIVEISDVADTTLGGGTLTINGSFNYVQGSKLIMNNANDKLIINGYFSALATGESLSAGQIVMNGGFAQATCNFIAGSNLAIKVQGANRLFYFNDPATSYFTKLELMNGASFDSQSLVSLGGDLSTDVNWMSIPRLYYRGNLNGHSLTTNSLTIPAEKSINVNGGAMSVNGNLDVQGNLIMANVNDIVTVAGDYTASSVFGSSGLTNGRLLLKGNFTRSGGYSSFIATDNHKTIFCGSANTQSITGFPDSSSKFAKLYITNDSFPSGSIPASTYYDTLTVTGTTLQSLSASAGTLSPTFVGSTYDYKLLLPTDTTGVTLTPTLLDRYGTPVSNAWLTFDNATTPATSVTVSDVPLDGSKTVRIVAHAADDVLAKTTTVKVERINQNLKAGTAGLGTLPAGAVASGAGTTFTVDMPATMESVSFAPVLDNPDSSLSIDGGAATKTVSVGVGASVKCTVVVTAQDGTTKKTYEVTFTRHQPLTALTSSTGGMAFNPATASYSITSAAATATITATAGADCNGTVTINGEAVTTKNIALTSGSVTKITVTAQDATGRTTTTYTVNISSVKLLSSIKLSTGKLSPAFYAGTTSYGVYLPNKTKSVTITPTKTSNCKLMTINGKKVTSVKLSPAAGGKATATIVCTHSSGYKQTYTVNVYRILPVSKISLSTGKLSPKFSPTKYSYKVSLPASTASVKITVAKTASCKELTINGKAVTSLTLSPAAGGSISAKVVATAQNGAKYTYTITVKRAAMLKKINLSAGKLSPAFNPTVMNYTVNVPSTTKQVTVTPVKMSGVKSITINGKPAKNVILKPAVGGEAKAIIVLTAGKVKTTYTVTVRRLALVSDINLSEGALSPSFSAGNSSYTVDLPAGTSSVTLTPVKGSNIKTLTMDAAMPVTVPLGGSKTVTITAIATDNVTKATYKVTLNRAAPLTALTVTGVTTGGNYPVDFAPGTTEYNIYIPYEEASVTVAATAAAGCSCTVNDLASPHTIAVPAGSNEIALVNVVRTSDSGDVESYKLRIHRLPQPVTALTVTAGGSDLLTPAFDYAAHDYTVAAVAGTKATVTVTPGNGATVTIDGIAGNTLEIAKPEDSGSKQVVVSVSPGHGFAPVVYTIVISWLI